MSTLTSYASQAARDSAAPAASNTGLCIFRTDTNAIEVSDGTNYQTYNSDGVAQSFPSNSYSAEFDGINDRITANTKFDFIQSTCNFSITAYVKFTDHTTTAANQSILGSTSTSSAKGLYLFYDNRTSGKSLRVIFPAGTTATIQVNNGITDNNWHHVAVTCAAGGTLKLYLDGSEIGSTSAPSTTATTAQHDFNLGAVLSGGTTPTSFLNGYLDEVAVFNREITSTEIANIRGTSHTYIAPTSIYRLENDADDEIGTNNGTNNGATFQTSEKPY